MPFPQRRVAVVLPWPTILKILAALVLVWLWFKLVEVVLVLIVAVLLAVTLDPVVSWFERRGLPRWGASLAVGLVGGFLWLTWASLSSQASYVTEHFGKFESETLSRLPQWARVSIGGDDM